MKNDFSYEEAFGTATPVATPIVKSSSDDFSYEEAFGVPERKPRSEAEIVLGGMGAGAQAVASEVATLGDMLLNTPTSIVGIGANLTRRVGGALSLEDRKASAKAGRELQEKIEATAPNLLKKFVNLFPVPGEVPGSTTHVEKAMGALMDWTDRDAAAMEERTGGAIKKEDVQLLRDTALSALGMKGITAPTKALVRRAGETGLQEMPPPKLPPEAEPTPPAKPLDQKAIIEDTTGLAGVQARTTKKALAVRRADVKAAFEAEPGYADYIRNLVDENLRQETNIALRPERTKTAEGVLAPRTPPAEATILRRDGTPDTTYIGQRSLDTGLAKVVQGKSFDLTAAEKVAIRGNARAWGGMIEKGAVDADLLAVMGVAGIGTALAMAYPDETKDLLTAAAGAGLFFSSSMRDLSKIPDTAPMSSVLAGVDTTLKTLERLPQNHFEYKKSLIEEQLRRQDVTKAEKDVLQAAMESVPGETITAKQLVEGFKKETASWELKKQETKEYADYGLENIGRDPWQALLPPDQRGRPREDNALDAIEMEANPNIAAATHVYQLPDHMLMDLPNHFDDPQYFGHTRVLKEDGVRHVVEVQSDLAQHAGKTLTSEEYMKTLEESNKVLKQKAIIDEAFLQDTANNPEAYGKALRDLEKRLSRIEPQFGGKLADAFVKERIINGRGDMLGVFTDVVDNLEGGYYTPEIIPRIERALTRVATDIGVRAHELELKLGGAAVSSQLSPILKNWPKRLIREELADARGAGESMVRFATADTVAKVEGWPNLQERFDASWGDNPPPGITRPTQRFTNEHQSIYDRYDKDITKFLKQLGGRDYVDHLGNSWVEVPTAVGGNRVQMFGGVKEDLLGGMGAAGVGAIVGAYLAGDQDVGGAILGAAGGLGARYLSSKSLRVKRSMEALTRGADYAGGLVSTRVKNISEPIHHRLVEHERQIFREGHKNLTTVAPFIEALNKVTGEQRKNLEAAILTNDPVAIRNAMQAARVPGLTTEWARTRQLLDDLGAENVKAGLLKNLREDYFPRVVKDVEGLLESLGIEQKTLLEKKLSQAEKLAIKSTGQGLSPEARTEIINTEMAKARVQGPGRASFRKQRSIEEVTRELLPYYESPIDSLTAYIRSSAREQARAKFFGKDLRKTVEDETEIVNVEDSIGVLVDRELANKNVSFRDVEEVKALLRSRFVGGDQASSAIVQDLKNIGYTSLLGHPTSALVQLSDVGQTMFTQGLLPTVEGVAIMLRGKGIKAKDFGLLDHVAEELASTRGTASLLNNTLKLVGFSSIDRFGKNNALTAALARHQRLAQTAKGQADIGVRYREAFGTDFPQLIDDLKARRKSDLVDSLLFHELSRQQPISKIEVPQAYLDNPNARAVYMLKTFMLKQADLARRDSYNEIRKGNVVKGTKNLIGLGLLWGVAGATNGWVRDWILGREVDPKLEDVTDNMLKTFGWSDYVFDKARQGKPLQAALGVAVPPVSIVDDTLRTAQKLAAGDVKKPSDLKGVQNIPVGGRLIYNRALGGAEDSDKKRKARERREERRRRAEERRNR